MAKIYLDDGSFKTSQQAGKRFLDNMDPDRLLAPCYLAIGLEPKNERYGGWEAKEIAGHSLGHYLSALAYMIETRGDKDLTDRLIYMLDELAFIQESGPGGYVGGVDPKKLEEAFQGIGEIERFSLNGVWVPWYSLHKIYAGLMDVYERLKNKKALGIVIKMSDWIIDQTKDMTEEMFQDMLYCEFGGMNETMATLYEVTGNESYLNLSYRFNHNELLDDLIAKENKLEGKHANTQIPKVIGFAKQYLTAGDKTMLEAAKFFFDQVTKHHSYIIGGNSFSEHFPEPDREPLGVATTETCNTYNMLRLAGELFKAEKSSHYMDYYEYGLVNHILASQEPVSGKKTYFVPTNAGSFKTYCTQDDSFWCCTGTGMENPGRYQEYIYLLDEEEKTLYINLYIASSYVDEKKKIEIHLQSDFPKQGKIEISAKLPKGYRLAIRQTDYSHGLVEESDYEQEGYCFFEMSRLPIMDGKAFTLSFTSEYKLKLYEAKDNPSHIGFIYGPIVLAAALGRDNFPESDILEDHTSLFSHPNITVPVLKKTDEDPLDKLKETNKEEMLFEYVDQDQDIRLLLKPFYKLHHERYALYLDYMSEQEYQSSLQLEGRDKFSDVLVDHISPYEQQSEIDHHYRGTNVKAGYNREIGKGFKVMAKGSCLSYQVQMPKGQEGYIYITLSRKKTEEFNKVDHAQGLQLSMNKIPLEQVNRKINETSELMEYVYLIPETLIQGKATSELTLMTGADNMEYEVYAIDIVNEQVEDEETSNEQE